jgi:hypothetical protein
VRRLLLASGILFLAMILIPWSPHRRHAWDVMAHAQDWFDRLWPPFLLAGGLAALAGGLVLGGRARAALAAAVGAAGYFLWFFVETPNMVLMWDGRWQMPVFLLALVAIPFGVLRHRQVLATLGALALAAVLLAPVALRGGDEILLAILLRRLAHPEKLMWPETAALFWWFILALTTVGTLVLWAARSHSLERILAGIVILWPAILALLTGVVHTVMVSGEPAVFWRLPVATMAPFILGALGCLLTFGIMELLGGPSPHGARA